MKARGRFATEAEALAYEKGLTACQEGRMAVPALDPHFMGLLKAMGPVKPGHAVRVLRAWTRGWHETNVARAVTP